MPNPRLQPAVRCTRSDDLLVAAAHPAGPPVFENAEARCARCRPKVLTLHRVDEHTRRRTLKRAGGRCECTRGWGCH